MGIRHFGVTYGYILSKIVDKFNMDMRKLNLYIYVLFNLLFGETSSFDEECKRDGIITNTLCFNSLNIDSHLIVSLVDTGDKYEELIKRIEKEVKNIKFNERDLERKKKVIT